jgi:hypothetical protein
MHRDPLISMPSSPRRPYPVTLQQAAQDSPTLAKLTQLARESGQQLEAVESLIPHSLRSAVRAGPIDGESWCLLVDSNAAAAKLRQLVPALLSRLRDRGTQITSIRLKVQVAGR